MDDGGGWLPGYSGTDAERIVGLIVIGTVLVPLGLAVLAAMLGR